jgi:hypothetical protein
MQPGPIEIGPYGRWPPRSSPKVGAFSKLRHFSSAFSSYTCAQWASLNYAQIRRDFEDESHKEIASSVVCILDSLSVPRQESLKAAVFWSSFRMAMTTSLMLFQTGYCASRTILRLPLSLSKRAAVEIDLLASLSMRSSCVFVSVRYCPEPDSPLRVAAPCAVGRLSRRRLIESSCMPRPQPVERSNRRE